MRSTVASAPAAIAPHPLLRRLADPRLELPLHVDHGPPNVLGLIRRARHAQLFELDLKAALRADAFAARKPDACTDAARDHGADRLRLGVVTEERHWHPRAVVEVAYEPEPPAATHEVHDRACRSL